MELLKRATVSCLPNGSSQVPWVVIQMSCMDAIERDGMHDAAYWSI
jgi:hypothetical protein